MAENTKGKQTDLNILENAQISGKNIFLVLSENPSFNLNIQSLLLGIVNILAAYYHAHPGRI